MELNSDNFDLTSSEDEAMREFTTEYPFDEISLGGIGMVAYGKAILAANGDSEFYVKQIILDDGRVLGRSGSGPLGSAWGKWVFETISAEIYKLDHAAEFFARELEEDSAPCPDRAYDEWRDRQLEVA